MKKENFKYYSAQIRGWHFRAALVFSILSFSGLNLQADSQTNSVVKTELVERIDRKPVYRININKAAFDSSTPLSDYSTFCIRSILDYYNIIRSTFKSYQNRLLLYNLLPINKKIKIPNSSFKDDSPLYLI